MEHKVVAVVAIGKNRELGLRDKLLWHITDDLTRFKQLTLGHPIIFGRKTFESIISYLGKALPGRTNIVVSRDKNLQKSLVERGLHDVVAVGSLEEALEVAKKYPGAEEIHIGGGAQMYEAALPHISKLYLTLVDDSKEADTFFPEYERLFRTKTFEEEREWNGLTYRWVDLER